MAQDSVRAGREHCHPSTPDTKKTMANRIHASVHDVQPAALGPVPDRSLAHPDREQLAPCNDAVLARGDLADPPIHTFRMQLSPHDGFKCRMSSGYAP